MGDSATLRRSKGIEDISEGELPKTILSLNECLRAAQCRKALFYCFLELRPATPGVAFLFPAPPLCHRSLSSLSSLFDRGFPLLLITIPDTVGNCYLPQFTVVAQQVARIATSSHSTSRLSTNNEALASLFNFFPGFS